MQQRIAFQLYINFYRQFTMLSLADRGRLITSIFEYIQGMDFTTTMPGSVEMAFAFIKDAIDRDACAYEEKCRRNSINGQKGGRPKLSKQAPKAADAPLEETEEQTSTQSAKAELPETPPSPQPEPPAKETLPSPLPEASPGGSPEPADGWVDESGEEIPMIVVPGVPEDYVRRRYGRAADYALANNQTVEQVLTNWWRWDRDNPRFKSKNHYQRSCSEADIKRAEEAFQAAIARGFRERME